MSLIRLQTNASGTGTLTIAAPNTNTDRTLTLPNSTGTIATDVTTLDQFNATGSAPVYACRAWVNFNGTGTIAIRTNGNVSSLTDNGVGDYTINYTTALPADNSPIATSSNDAGAASGICPEIVAVNTTSFRFRTRRGGGAVTDNSEICVAVFR